MTEFSKRKSINDKLSKYDILAKDSDFIEVTEWTNGEGFDISINERLINLTYGELEAINHLVKSLEYDFEDNANKK